MFWRGSKSCLHLENESEKGLRREKKNTSMGIPYSRLLLLLVHSSQPNSVGLLWKSLVIRCQKETTAHRKPIRNTTLLHRLMSILVAGNVILVLPRKNRMPALEGDLGKVCWEGRRKQVLSIETKVLRHWKRNK